MTTENNITKKDVEHVATLAKLKFNDEQRFSGYFK
jgi:aspartyl-tRNA(Asn)/glutamyl-tRNA(Gln) amidotransferase subunit C